MKYAVVQLVRKEVWSLNMRTNDLILRAQNGTGVQQGMQVYQHEVRKRTRALG